MEIFRYLRNSKGEHWIDGFFWVAWSLWGFLPVFVTILVLTLYNQELFLAVFTDNGEFAIYSATYLGAAFYMVMKDREDKRFPSHGVVTFLLVGLLVLSALLYSHVAIQNVLAKGEYASVVPKLDREMIRTISQIMLPIVLALAYFVVVAENVRTNPDPRKISQRQYEELTKDFESLGGDENE